MIGKGERLGDLYILDLTRYAPAHNSLAKHVSVQLLHQRFGHPSFKVLEPVKHQLAFDYSKPITEDPCCICPFAKQKRLPFVSHNHLSSIPFELVHCDIWGLFHETSHSGRRYFLTLVDDCTRFTWIL